MNKGWPARSGTALIIGLVLLTSGVASDAQVRRPADERLPPPVFPTDTAERPFLLPPVEETDPAGTPLSGRARVFVRRFDIVGNTVLDPADLKKTADPYIGKEVTGAELQTLRQQLTQMYVKAGYINSGVILPDQTVRDGVITLQVIEGTLSRVEATGLRRLRPSYVEKRLAVDGDRPLRLETLEERLRSLREDRLIERLEGHLTPGERPGTGVLTVDVEESRPYVLGVGADNHRAPSVGSIRGRLFAEHWNLTGRGDALAVELGLTEGLNDIGLRYALPLSARGLTLNLEYDKSDSEVIERPFDALGIESDFRRVALGLRHPIHRALQRRFDVALRFENARGRTAFLGGIPFPSAGARDGKSEVSAIRLSGEWIERRPDHVIAARATLSWGIDALGATINDEAPDGRFFSGLGQFQWARRFANRGQLIFRADAQLAADPLLSLERFAVGGANSVRGYRENQLVRDSGWTASLEYRHPLWRDEAGFSPLQLAVFADYGNAWNKGGDTPSPRSLSGAGLGLRWDPSPYLHAELYGAIPFRALDQTDDDLQDDGVHFLLTYRLF